MLVSVRSTRSSGRATPSARATFTPDLAKQVPGRRGLAQHPERLTGRRGQARLGADENVLGPQRCANIVDEAGVDSGPLTGREKGFKALSARPVQLPEDDPGRAARVADDAGLGNAGEYVGRSAGHMLGPDSGRQLFFVVDAVLQRDDHRIGPEQRR